MWKQRNDDTAGTRNAKISHLIVRITPNLTRSLPPCFKRTECEVYSRFLWVCFKHLKVTKKTCSPFCKKQIMWNKASPPSAWHFTFHLLTLKMNTLVLELVKVQTATDLWNMFLFFLVLLYKKCKRSDIEMWKMDFVSALVTTNNTSRSGVDLHSAAGFTFGTNHCKHVSKQ